MAVPPRDPWYRRRYGFYTPFYGWGCLWTLLLLILFYWLLSLVIAPLAFWVS